MAAREEGKGTGMVRETGARCARVRLLRSIPGPGGGLVVFIDEMGKFLEAAARDGTDVSPVSATCRTRFAQRSPTARHRDPSSGLRGVRVLPLGRRSARRVGEDSGPVRGSRDQHYGTWRADRFAPACDQDRGTMPQDAAASCQGRRADSCRAHTPDLVGCARGAAGLCTPSPACLLGPLSRRRFGQNQRSLFAFLNSAEPEADSGTFLGRAEREVSSMVRIACGTTCASISSLRSSPPPTATAGRLRRMHSAGARRWAGRNCTSDY